MFVSLDVNSNLLEVPSGFPSSVTGRFSAAISSPPYARFGQKATVHKKVDIVVNPNTLVEEDHVDIDDSVLIHEIGTGKSEAGSAEGELV
ncbi:hypothetical protein B0T13DRAFT_512009 [Neurospora crassa]|nr:hypothetical protein B0T13DRAFT_512009 [Neurospora crassa]